MPLLGTCIKYPRGQLWGYLSYILLRRTCSPAHPLTCQECGSLSQDEFPVSSHPKSSWPLLHLGVGSRTKKPSCWGPKGPLRCAQGAWGLRQDSSWLICPSGCIGLQHITPPQQKEKCVLSLEQKSWGRAALGQLIHWRNNFFFQGLRFLFLPASSGFGLVSGVAP